MSITSHSKTLLSTSPQLMPGMSLSVCMCLNCRPSSPAAADVGVAMVGKVWAGVSVSVYSCRRRRSLAGCGAQVGPDLSVDGVFGERQRSFEEEVVYRVLCSVKTRRVIVIALERCGQGVKCFVHGAPVT